MLSRRSLFGSVLAGLTLAVAARVVPWELSSDLPVVFFQSDAAWYGGSAPEPLGTIFASDCETIRLSGRWGEAS